MTDSTIKVWDPFVRFFHWSLVATFSIAYVTEDELLAVHVWAGYLVAGLILLRVLWGFIGPRHARFSDFVFRPVFVLAYLRDLIGFRSKRYVGHSPAGGAMVVALLLGLSVIVGTGLVTHAVRNNAGPLAGIMTSDSGVGDASVVAAKRTETPRLSERARSPKPGRIWKSLHELSANLVLVLIVLHVLGVVFSSLAHRENLARAMITGRKRTNPD